MIPTLDDIDRKILALLMDDARLPVATIARQLDIARTTAIARIANLEARGVIAGYGVRLSQIPGKPQVCAYVGLAVEPAKATPLVKALEKMAQVETLCAVSGPVDYMLTLRCESTAELDRVLDQIGAIAGVRQTSTSIILSKRIDRRPL